MATNYIKLNEYGLAIWKHDHYNFTAERAYSWVDRILVMDESRGRLVMQDVPYSTFDFREWTPVTMLEYLEMIKPIG